VRNAEHPTAGRGKDEMEKDATNAESPFVDYSGAERYTTLHRVTLYRAVRAGRLKASGYGRAVRFHRRDLDEFMAARDGRDR
jgi:excisionase family DNA binding protein